MNCNTTHYRANSSSVPGDPTIPPEFVQQREWLIKVIFEQHLLPALMLFTEQMTTVMADQILAVGMIFDAKEQLEAQRTLQDMNTRAVKDYYPSESVCVFGTNMRSLAASEQNTALTPPVINARALQRELLSGQGSSVESTVSDLHSRLEQFRVLYCNPADNGGAGNGLAPVCTGSANPQRYNRDLDYTSVIEAPMTLEIDFTPEGDNTNVTRAGFNPAVAPTEEDIFALSSNLYAHTVPPYLPPAFLTTTDGRINPTGVDQLMNIRALAAKRSVARNSFASIAALKTPGETEVLPYMRAIIKEMGLANEEEITTYLGERPSYYAQMEVLTKKLYQNPYFFTDLYDKPVNVDRKIASMQAIELMQQRDIYRSQLRTEASIAVLLETALMDSQSQAINELNRVNPAESPMIVLPP